MKMWCCKKCKKWENLKIVTPYDKKGIWLVCENCKTEKNISKLDNVEELRHIYQIYIECLSHRFVYGNLEIEDIKKLVWEKVTEQYAESGDGEE